MNHFRTLHTIPGSQRNLIRGAMAAGVLVAFFLCAANARANGIVPLRINHQGVISVNGAPFNGTGQFRFALINLDSMNAWTNDGSALDTTGTPTLAVSLPVSNGLYSVRLGDTALTNMVGIPPDLFAAGAPSLRVWFDDGVNGVRQLLPDQLISSVPYAFMAENALTATDAINSLPSFFGRFGGSGADGAMTVSGTVNLGAMRREFNTLDVPLGSTLVASGGWAFIGVRGRCTIAGTVSANGKGELGGLAADVSGILSTEFGHPGTSAAGTSDRSVVPNCPTGAGGGGGGSTVDGLLGGTGGGARSLGGIGGNLGAGGPAFNPTRPVIVAGSDSVTSGSGRTLVNAFAPLLYFRGAGGGSGSAGIGPSRSGRGGNGGGVIYIECDELEFTGTLTANGENGLNATDSPAGGGGGGGGGVILVRARKIITSTGTVTVSGGLGGTQLGGGGNGGIGVGGFWDIVGLQ